MSDRELQAWLDERRPLNWDDMGSSARDLWEARMTRSYVKDADEATWAAPDYTRGVAAGIKYWTDRPNLIHMAPAKRKWLDKQSDDFRRGFADGAATVP